MKKKNKVLVIVDPIKDFFKNGNLEVPQSNEIFPYVNEQMKSDEYSAVILIHEQHPEKHISFASTHGKTFPCESIQIQLPSGQTILQDLWPDHCVVGTTGDQVCDELDMDHVTHVVKKGLNKDVDSYSGVMDSDGTPTGLTGLINGLGENLQCDVVGVATEYCVKATALDLSKDFRVNLLTKGCRGIDPQKIKDTYKELRKNGIVVQDQAINIEL